MKPETLVGAARRAAREEALGNFRQLLSLPFPVAIENPARSFINKAIRPPDQVIQPYEFGDDASKATGLWLSGDVPKLVGTHYVEPRMVGHLPRWANQTDSGQNRLRSKQTQVKTDYLPQQTAGWRDQKHTQESLRQWVNNGADGSRGNQNEKSHANPNSRTFNLCLRS